MGTELAIAIVTSSVAAISSIVCAWLANRNGKDAKDYRNKREKLDKAKWKVLIATMDGVSLLLHQAHGEKLNGNIDVALKDIGDAKKELDEINTEILAQT